jgi:hypothetical protein
MAIAFALTVAFQHVLVALPRIHEIFAALAFEALEFIQGTNFL